MPMMPGRNDENSPYLFVDYLFMTRCTSPYFVIMKQSNALQSLQYGSVKSLSIGISTAVENIYFRHR